MKTRDYYIHDLLDSLNRHYIGFDSLFNSIPQYESAKQQSNFPPYSIRREGENRYSIDLAVAGFDKEDIDIQIKENVLTIKGDRAADDNEEYLFRGIANRSFQRSFTLDENVVIRGAVMKNGILNIFLEKIVPENKKPRTINIVDDRMLLDQPKPELLTETVVS